MIRPLFALVLWVSLEGCTGQSKEAYQTVEFQVPSDGIVAGHSNAPVVLVEFGNYYCPACKELGDSVLPAMKTRYLDKGAIQFRYMEAGPILADGLAAFVECAARELGFFRAHHRLYEVLAYGPDSTGLLDDGNCVKSRERAARRTTERAISNRIGVPGTPTLVLGRFYPPNRVVGWSIVGAPTQDSLFKLIDTVVAKYGTQKKLGNTGAIE